MILLFVKSGVDLLIQVYGRVGSGGLHSQHIFWKHKQYKYMAVEPLYVFLKEVDTENKPVMRETYYIIQKYIRH